MLKNNKINISASYNTHDFCATLIYSYIIDNSTDPYVWESGRFSDNFKALTLLTLNIAACHLRSPRPVQRPHQPHGQLMTQSCSRTVRTRPARHALRWKQTRFRSYVI